MPNPKVSWTVPVFALVCMPSYWRFQRVSSCVVLFWVQLGTVTNNVADAVKAAKQGRVDFRVDKTGIVHAGLGKVLPGSFLAPVHCPESENGFSTAELAGKLLRSSPSGERRCLRGGLARS